MKYGIYVAAVDQNGVTVAAKAILSIINATANENVAVAGLNCLTSLAKSPTNMSISNCNITSNPAPRAKR